MDSIKIGDVVQLKSGGPKMTVQRVIGSDQSNLGLKASDEFLKLKGFRDGDVVCNWFEASSLKDGTFKVEGLNISEP
ncbi:MAG: DUF2158 domain-containing protein [Williamsia sp.]|nr:DUF2158 domain-containing protein [Williamsia sp.]